MNEQEMIVKAIRCNIACEFIKAFCDNDYHTMDEYIAVIIGAELPKKEEKKNA